jgi:hypothetical protein
MQHQIVGGGYVAEVLGEDQKVLGLLQGAFGYVVKAYLFLDPTPLEPLRNVGRDRDGSPAHL